MSARKSKKNERGGREKSHAFYVYCVGEQDALAPLIEGDIPAGIEEDASVDLVSCEHLAAIASTVPLADYNEEALQARLADPAWTAIRAMRHEKVVEYFAPRASVIPLRFGTIYLERRGIEQMLSQRESELRSIIERLRGRQEWGVNVYSDQVKLLSDITALSPRLKDLSERAGTASPGQSYLLRKKIDALRKDEARAETKRVAALIERELAALCDGATRLRVLKDEATEHGELVAKLAFLVARARFDEFRAVAERLAQEHAPAGFQLELTGPWPTYNFATVQSGSGV